MTTFRNEALIDFTVSSQRDSFQSALEMVADSIKDNRYRAAPLIDGMVVSPAGPAETIERLDPSNSSRLIGRVTCAGLAEAERAIDSVVSGGRAWEDFGFERRCSIIRSLAAIMRERRKMLAALMVFEVGKPWREADADVCEAIDFCEYYALEMLRLGPAVLTSEVPGEDNRYFYQPRGVVVVISPWNFPLAIACGMTVAALVTGNATILKPAEQSSLIAQEFASMVLESGVPGSAFAFLPGRGESIGRFLVASPQVSMICFTGSKAVGLEIVREAATMREGQRHIKRVVAELGGKNAIIVDEDADLDEAIKGILVSAFGYAGQKCSACSRVLVVGDAYEPFLARMQGAARDMIVGESSDPATCMGPVIDSEAQERIQGIIARAKSGSKLLFEGKVPTQGYFVPPTLFRDVDPGSEVWRNEIFGPVVACARASDFEEALMRANDSEYALTGGLYSRSPANIERARRSFKVGNLYINRSCTGALVCRQPFGGFRLSGVGSKAGGPDYLLQFMEPRVVTENTMRRGFTPET